MNRWVYTPSGTQVSRETTALVVVFITQVSAGVTTSVPVIT